MKNILRRAFLTILAAALILTVLFSCAKKEDEILNGDEEAVKTAGKIRVLVCAENPPFEFLAGEDVVGADVIFAEAIADAFHVSVEFVTGNFADLEDMLINGEGDIIISSYPATHVVHKELTVSEPYHSDSLYAIVKEASEITKEEDLKGKIIGVQTKTEAQLFAEDHLNAKHIETYEFISDALAPLKDGTLEAVITDKASSAILQEEAGDGYRRIYIGGHSDDYVVIMREGSDLKARINSIITDYFKNQDFMEIVPRFTMRTEEEKQEENEGE